MANVKKEKRSEACRERMRTAGKEQYERDLRPHCFQPGQSGNPAGRPKGAKNKVNRIPELLKSVLGAKKAAEIDGLSMDEVDSIENLVLALGIKELNKLGAAESSPAYLTTLSRAAIMDMKNGRTKVMDLLRDRQFGAVKKEVDVTTNGGSLGAPATMTPEEAKQVLKKIEEEY